MTEMYNGNGIWIPIEVLHSKDLTPSEKILYAEIYYLDRPDTHCYASNEYLARFLGLSDSGLRKCLTHLKQLGYIETISFDGRNRVLATTVKWTNQTATTVAVRTTPEYQSESYKNEFLLYRENKKENSRESTGAGASVKHPRNFSRETLTDDLQSGKDIDEQNKVKKRITKYEKCLAEIDKRDFSEYHKTLLREHLSWSFNSSDPNRNNEPRKYAKRLDELLQLKGDLTKIILQSRDKKWHCFYEVKQQTTKSYSDHSDGIITQTLSQEEAAEVLAREAEEYGTI